VEIATRVGYDSEAAFKRATGSPPAAWRKGVMLVNGVQATG
jgi:AraC-like DNA-binding protein